jgi:hypothetical protein
MGARQVVSGVQDEYVEPRLCALKALPNVASTATLSKSDVKALARIVVVHISASDSDVRHAAEHAYAALCTNPGRGAIDMLAVKNGQGDVEVIPPPAAPARQRVSEPPAPAVTYPAGAVGDEVALLVAQVLRPPLSSRSIDFTAVVVVMSISFILAYVTPRLFCRHDH